MNFDIIGDVKEIVTIAKGAGKQGGWEAGKIIGQDYRVLDCGNG